MTTRSAWLVLLLCVPVLSQAQPAPAPGGTSAATPKEATNNASRVRYRADYVVNADATYTETDYNDILVKTKAGVDGYSQIRLDFSSKRETLDVLEAYTVGADGKRRDVPKDKIYSQESYSSASGPMYADYKVKVIVFPDLAPGSHLVYSFRKHVLKPTFKGYFHTLETFSPFEQFDDAEVTLQAPTSMPMHVFTRDVQGGKPVVAGDRTSWRWRYRRSEPLKSQTMAAEVWEYGPTVMASTYSGFAELGRAYDIKARTAATVTPAIRAQANAITQGIDGHRAQAQAIYEWVAKNIRYVAIYLGNGGYEPNSADSILANRYGDCKDHTVILEALLAAKGIASTPVLIGAGGGPEWSQVALLERFNHAINYVPEFDLYLDSTSPYARFGQLPGGDLGKPVVHTRDGRLGYTPDNNAERNFTNIVATFRYSADGNAKGQTRIDIGSVNEIGLRGAFAQVTSQVRSMVEQSFLGQAGLIGSGKLELHGDATDLRQPFGYDFGFEASDIVDFSVPGGMTLPWPPGSGSLRNRYQRFANPTNDVPFVCSDELREQETYVLEFPATVKLDAIPKDMEFHNAAGEYSMRWQREGQKVTAVHALQMNAVRGAHALCQPQDYGLYRALMQAVRRGFRAQVVYGDLTSQR
ncbi:MAG: DUF3857 domain-containing protein [Proteobacteria bacterium]|nr:DUF3857 domain-containing protein [Pseudomonadota bacterium]